MFQAIQKYRRLLAALVTGFYLFGGLQFPVLECLHFFSHLDELSSGNFASHSFHSHDSNHDHNTLAVLDSMDENASHEEGPVNETADFSSKKSPQVFCGQRQLSQWYSNNMVAVQIEPGPLTSLTPSVPSPPPRA